MTSMDPREPGFEDITFDLIAAHFRLLKAEHDYGRYVCDAVHVGRPDIAEFFRRAMAEDSARARQCYEFLKDLGVSGQAGPAGVRGVPARQHTSSRNGRQQ
jgi:rubrerythrin